MRPPVPGDANAWCNLGLLLEEQPGREGEAEHAYREAARAGSAEGWFNLGVVLARAAGREIDAEHAYRAASRPGRRLGSASP